MGLDRVGPPVGTWQWAVEAAAEAALPPQRIDQRIQLVRDGLHLEVLRRVVIDGEVQVPHAVAVAARAGDGGGELGLQGGDLCVEGVYLRLQRSELRAHLCAGVWRMVGGVGGVEGHGDLRFRI